MYIEEPTHAADSKSVYMSSLPECFLGHKELPPISKYCPAAPLCSLFPSRMEKGKTPWGFGCKFITLANRRQLLHIKRNNNEKSEAACKKCNIYITAHTHPTIRGTYMYVGLKLGPAAKSEDMASDRVTHIPILACLTASQRSNFVFN